MQGAEAVEVHALAVKWSARVVVGGWRLQGLRLGRTRRAVGCWGRGRGRDYRAHGPASDFPL